MPNVTANEIQIEYDTFGDSTSPPLLLIIGLGGQMVYWDEELCKKFANAGLFVIRFDNRDAGLSSKIEEAGVPDIMQAAQARASGQEIKTPYTHNDMADDAMGLLDELNLEKAHICGISMGSAITQIISVRHPSRVLSLIPIMGGTGNPENPPAKPEAMAPFLSAPPENAEREVVVDFFVNSNRMWAGSGYPFNEDWFKKKASETYDRSWYPSGIARQMLAGMVIGDRRADLASVKAPTLVIHGADDPVVHVDAGKDTAKSIPGAEFLIIEGMGHEFPHGTGAWVEVSDAIIAHTSKFAP